uniref:Uncharacterized protein n=1 Tax=Ciona intestinalis TaxID=7719 RepID=F6WAL5_CIOIN
MFYPAYQARDVTTRCRNHRMIHHRRQDDVTE